MNRGLGLGKLLQIGCGVGLCVALVLGIGYAYRQVATDLDLGPGSNPWTWHLLLEREFFREIRLDDQLEEARRRMVIKSWVEEQLIAQRITLLEAAHRFRDLSTADPHFMTRLRRHFPSQSDEESLCRHVLQHVGESLSKRPSQAAVVLPRLEAELCELLHRYDAVRLLPTVVD